MKVQIITSYSFRKSPPVRNRLLPIIKSYLDLGFEVELISSDKSNVSDYYKELRDYRNFIHTTVEPFVTVKKNFFVRAIVELLFSIRIFYVANNSKIDIRVITIPSMFLTLPLIFFSHKSMVVVDVRDLTWEYLTENTLFKYILKKGLRWLVLKGLITGDIITTTNRKELAYVKKLSPNSMCYLLSNGISNERYNDLLQIKNKRIGKKIKVAYIGTVGIAQNLITLIKAAKKRPKIEFKVIGDGIELEALIKYCDSNQVSNVEFLGSISWEDILKVYNDVDVLYANISPNYVTAVPSKIFEYIVVGKPVIFGSVGESREILKNFKHVTLIKPDDVDQLISSLDDLDESIESDAIDYNRSIIKNSYIREETSKVVVSKITGISRRN